MYKRVEQIEEENLDWDQQNLGLIEELQVQKENVIFSPTFKSKIRLWQSITELDIQKRMMKLLEKNLEISSFMGILLLPYLVGFLVGYALFHNYGGMTIMDFLSIEKDHILFQLWSIGAYLFVTLWVFWAFSKVAQSSKQLLHLHHR